MKYKFWDTENNCWFKPVYQADKGKLEELLVTQSGELTLRKLQDGEVKFTHESLFPDRFVKCRYTGVNDIEGAKLFHFDIVKCKDGEHRMIDFGFFYEKFGGGRVAGFFIPIDCEKVGNKFENPELLTLVKIINLDK